MKFTKETLMKTLRTFIQSALAYIIVGLAAFDNWEDWRTGVIGLAISAIAAGLCAVMNLESKPARITYDDDDDDYDYDDYEDEEDDDEEGVG